jgi:rfaE bifunctional protein kinase chain/domain
MTAANEAQDLLSAQAIVDLKARLGRARVLVVGDAMLDRYWFGSVDRVSPEAPVPVVRVTREDERLGGAANVAFNVNQLGARATLMTVVGADDAAQRLRQLLDRHGIASELGSDPQLYTTVKLRIIGRAQQLLRVDFENQPDHEVLAGMLSRFEAVLGEHDSVLFSDYGKGGLAHIPQMIALARGAGKTVLVDPKGSDWTRYAGASVITPNRTELAQVLGAWESESALESLAQAFRQRLRFDSLLLTRSEEGMSIFDADGHTRQPAKAREVFDVTGAGDTVIATMAAMMACGMTARSAMLLANKAGGIVVGKFGTAGVSQSELLD